MAIGVNWAEIWAPVWKAVWTQVPPVEVPDVVGETQAAGTATLEGDGFVVSVSTAYSSTVAAGIIISQSPEGGEFAASGSTVAIVVSLGPEPVTETADQPTGGWLAYNEREQQRRRAAKRRRQELEEETERIEDELARQIAQEFRIQERKDERREELKRLKESLEAKHLEAIRQYSERVGAAYAAALEKGTTAALDRLDRELKKAREEEELAALLITFEMLH